MAINENLLERREYKYIIDEKTAENIRKWINPFCELDPNASENGSYLIDSLYFDTDDLALYRANDVEQVDRVKLRIRGYPAMNHRLLFLEVKRRVNDVVAKTRGKVPKELLPHILTNPTRSAFEQVGEKSRRAVDRFVYYTECHRMSPKALIRYEREPWMSTIDDYARITFDYKIRSCEATQLSMAPQADWRYIDDAISMKADNSFVVLELKFESEKLPIWLVDLVQSMDLQRRSFSKYGRSVDAWYTELPELRYAV